MTKRIRSARGVEVDFDLIRIKEQIASGPKPVNVQSREEFIDRRVRKRAKKRAVVQSNAVDVGLELDQQQDEQLELIEPEVQSQPKSVDEPVRTIKKKTI